MNEPILSFCISTFNRSEKVLALVKEILTYSELDIEVVVSDNCSSDNTNIKLSDVIDTRFRYYRNDLNIGAIGNYVRAMSLAKGKYVFFCTDKDFIKSSAISDLVKFFATNSEIVAGYCTLDITHIQKDEIFDPGIKSLIRLGYLSKHPTGYFYRRDELKQLQIVDNYTKEEKVGTFPFEFITADLCMKGKVAIVNIPLCYIEPMADVKNIKSYSYSGTDNNLYFSPFQRYKTFERYLSHIQTLELLAKERRKLIKRVFWCGLGGATYEYKKMVENKVVCDHYNMPLRHIGIFKICSLDYEFSKKFITSGNYATTLGRLVICVDVHIKFLFTIVLKKVRLTNLFERR